MTKQDIEGIKKPVSFACVGRCFTPFVVRPRELISIENDNFFPDDIRSEGQKYLQDNGFEHEMRIYGGVPHGNYPLYIP